MLESSDRKCYCRVCFRNKIAAESSGDQTEEKNQRTGGKLIPYPAMFCQHSEPHGRRAISANMTPPSKRPLQCPKADCNKYISVFTLESHFRYEHKEVPVILTQLDARSGSVFSPKNLRYGITNCIALVSVMDFDFSNIMQQSSHHKQPTPGSRHNSSPLPSDTGPVMVLMATRLASCHLSLLPSSDASSTAYSESNCTKVGVEEETCTVQQNLEYNTGPLCPNDKVSDGMKWIHCRYISLWSTDVEIQFKAILTLNLR
nr:unnamed protein product [Callosobruchus chinensis]